MRRAVREMLARSKTKSYKNLLTGKDTVPMAKEYQEAVAEGKNGDDLIRFKDF